MGKIWKVGERVDEGSFHIFAEDGGSPTIGTTRKMTRTFDATDKDGSQFHEKIKLSYFVFQSNPQRLHFLHFEE